MLKKAKIFIFFCITLLATQSGFSQIQMALEFTQEQYIQHEGIGLDYQSGQRLRHTADFW